MIEKEYIEGFNAFDAGKDIFECPYKNGTRQYDLWRAGWLKAESLYMRV